MNDKQKKAAILQKYLQILPTYREINEDGIKLYISVLEDIPADRVERAFRELIKTAKRFPAPAEVIEASEMVMTDEERDARTAAIRAKNDAWTKAQIAAFEANHE